MRKQLLIEEMKRAIQIMESKTELKRTITVDEGRYPWQEVDRDVVELFQLLKMIRKHSTRLEKEMVR